MSAQVLTAGFRLRHSRLACSSTFEVSRGAVAVEEEQLVSFAVEQSKCCSICTVTLGPCGNLPFTSWGRWQCLRGAADAGLNRCYAACGCGALYRCGAFCKLTLGPCRNLPFTSWGRWKCLRGGADAGLDNFYAACGCGKEYRCGALCTVTLGPCGDLPFKGWGRWKCFRGGADVGLNSCYAVCGCGT